MTIEFDCVKALGANLEAKQRCQKERLTNEDVAVIRKLVIDQLELSTEHAMQIFNTVTVDPNWKGL